MLSSATKQALVPHTTGPCALSGRLPCSARHHSSCRAQSLQSRAPMPIRSRQCTLTGLQASSGSSALLTDAQTHQARIVEQFDGRAAAYDNYNSYHPPLADVLLRLAAPSPGESVLDVACGTGLVALRAAVAVGQGGQVVGVDLSEAMLQQARAKSAAQGLTNTTWRQCNIEEASFPPASFDIITCSAAMPFLRNIPAALQQWRGWLRPGGRLVLNSWEAPPGAVIDYGTFCQVASDFGLGIEDPCARLGSKKLVETALQGAGFSDMTVEAEHKARTYPADSPAAYAEEMFVQSCSMNPWHEALSEHTMPGRFDQSRDACIARITADTTSRFKDEEGVSSPYTVLHVLACK